MIKFTCKNCGQKIKVPEVHADKKGKCPKCKNLVIVPKIKSTEPTSDEKPLSIAQQHGSVLPASELQLKKEPVIQPEKPNRISANAFDTAYHLEQITKMEEAEKPPVRKLPWLLDIFLYPTSISGLINLVIFWLLPFLIRFVGILPICFIRILCFFASFVVAGYMYYYLMECIRDSAQGGIRAPENIGSMPDTNEAVWQLLEILLSFVIFWGPVGAYYIYKTTWQSVDLGMEYNPRTDIIFWLLLGYGIFFFPMGILAIAMFKSTSAYNPFLWIASISRTFFRYCMLVLFLGVLIWLVSRITSSYQQSLLFTFFFGAVFIYLAMVVAHLLGRFYYLNSRKLNWEA